MWAVKWILIVFLLLFFIYFGADNSSTRVYVKFFLWRSPELQLWMVMYFSFAVGMVVWLLGSIFKVLELKNTIRNLNKETEVLKRELDDLRNISIDEESAQFGELQDEMKF